jgi:predicted phosphoribosyltransferase
MGAVVDGGAPIIVRNEDVIRLAAVDETSFKAICDAELAEIERRRQQYLDRREPANIAGQTADDDDGIATGATTRAALHATRMRSPKKLVLAVPVAPTATLTAMREEADEVVCLEDYDLFGAIGFYYRDFRRPCHPSWRKKVGRLSGRGFGIESTRVQSSQANSGCMLSGARAKSSRDRRLLDRTSCPGHQ